ncbi:hypothetical protein SOCEGT47_037640 [Sorangium cellulosum]|uniref:PRC-barrel domain-containing protein n=1 Tax=Sorangium cellulosum TaxID=56 RepID=A0A4P2Q2B3_SORCE|nr:hypothetical protein [Sorangium cellulosum]AUX23241.1 hypothetical protein SOCEGT47_037640 [Sorangium cellulosum]
MQLDFDMPVVADDGLEAGVLDRVLVDRERGVLTHVVLRAPFASEELLVSMDLVQGTTGGSLRLRPGRDELAVLPRYYEGRTSSLAQGRVDTSRVPQPPERRQELDEALGLSTDTIELGPETRVMTTDQAEVQLVGIGANDPGNDISRLRVRGPAGARADFPASWIDILREDVVALTVARDDILQSRPAPRLEDDKLTDLEGLSGMGGLDGDTPEEMFGPDFVDELRDKSGAFLGVPATGGPAEATDSRAVQPVGSGNEAGAERRRSPRG